MKKRFIVIFLFFFIFSTQSGCQGGVNLNPKNPITLTFWHNYGGQMKNTMDQLIDEFNATIGAEKGIILNVTSISGSATLHEKLTMSANEDPGAPELPDLTTAYPKTALLLAQKGLLVNLDRLFTEEELSAYVPPFLEEGRFLDNGLYVFPTAKSTEVLFVNKTLFNRFARENDVSFKDLETFEGIIKAAEKYYRWTDAQTPEIKNDGKMFFVPDSLFNLTQVGYRQLGDDFLKDNKANFSSPVFSKIWDCYYKPAVKGYLAIIDGYGSDLAKTGDIVCTTGSSAGILFFPPTVTYADNTSEPVEYSILPYPVFEGGKKIAIQRGSGMCVIKSTPEKEYAAGVFLKWFTEPEQNLRFVASTGYLPVTKEAFGEIMNKEIENINDPTVQKLLTTAIQMQQEYDFYIPPLFEEFDSLGKEYENKMKKIASNSRQDYLKLLAQVGEQEAFEKIEVTVEQAKTMLEQK